MDQVPQHAFEALGKRLHNSTLRGDAAEIRLCLAAGCPVDGQAWWTPTGGTALHTACIWGQTHIAQLLLEAGADPCALDRRSLMPLACAVCFDPISQYAMYRATASGCADLVRLFLAAAPQAALARSPEGLTPLQFAIHHLNPLNFGAALLLIRDAPLQSAVEILQTLQSSRGSPSHVLPLYVALAERQALTRTEWDLVPSPCSGLGTALPVVLRRSEAEAALLVARLWPAERLRLRTAALCLARAQRGLSAPLPVPLMRDILLQAVAA